MSSSMADALATLPLDAERGPDAGPRFDVVRTLGSGGMGVVYEVVDRAMNARVAAKVLPRSDAQGVLRFKREFRSLARIVHPNLVALYELIAHDGEWFFTMELVDGVDVATWVAPEGAVDVERVVQVLRQLATGLAFLHAAGVLHRDLKPGNVLVTQSGQVKLLDFGLAQSLTVAETTGEQGVGTLAYMSPEQMFGEVLTPASDFYGVGAMLAEMLSGALPFGGPPSAVLAQKMAARVPGLDQVTDRIPGPLVALCRDLLDADAAARPDATAILRRLAPLAPTPAGDTGGHAQAAGPPSRGTRVIGREAQLRALRDAADAARGGAACVVGARGRSGSGKSVLVGHFLETLARDGALLLLAGRCYEQESVPYKGVDAVVDSLTRHLCALPAAELDALLPEGMELLAQLFPVLQRIDGVGDGARVGDLIPDRRERRRQAFAAFRTLLTRLAARRLVVVHIDDLQWGDADSAALLLALLEPPDPPPLLLVISYRSEYEGQSACLRALLQADALAPLRRIVEVGALAAPDAERLAGELLAGVPGAAAHAARIAGEAGGNPYFIAELARSVRGRAHEDGVLRTAEFSLDDVLWGRVADLPTEDRELIELLSISARPLRLRHARDAASPGAFGPQLIARLRAQQLVRSTGPSLNDELEVYHDRVRESVAARMPADARVQCHGRLARTLAVDAETIAVHFERAGDRDHAGAYYARAAGVASQALAFDRAAKLYRASIDLRPALGDAAAPLRIQLGHALANAGRSGEAGESFLAAARAVPDDDGRTDLLRLAATQLCIAGRVDEGRTIFREAMRRAGLSLPNAGLGILPALLLRRARVELSDLEAARHADGPGDPRSLARVDLLWSVSTSLSGVDHVGVASLQAKALLIALRAREPQRLARCLGWEAVLRASGGAKNGPTVARLLGIADELATRIGEPHALGMVQMARAWSAFLQGDFPRALVHAHPAVDTFRERCTGVAWELVMSQTAISWAFVHIGDTHGVRRSIRDYYDGAGGGNLVLTTNFLSVTHPFLALADDDPADSDAYLGEALARWPHAGYHVQHVSLLWSRSRLDLYRGDAGASLARFDREWAPMRRALHLRGQLTRVTALDCRGRSALSLAIERGAAGRASAGALLARAERDAMALAREGEAWVAPYADRLRGLLALRRGNEAEAARRLRAAHEGFARSGATLDAAVAQRRYGQIVGGDVGRSAVAAADAGMRQLGVRNPEAMTRMLSAP
jgi:tetratricopeptide (TPR) repeat protein